MGRHELALLALLALAVAGSGCQSEACERGRMELSSTWENLRDTALSRQQPPRGTVLGEKVQEARLVAWTKIQEHAELIRSSFSTPQITWSPAEKARRELEEWFSRVSDKDDPMVQGFSDLLREADSSFERLKASCR